MEHHLRVMASKDCVLSCRTSGPNYRTKQMGSGDARDPWVTGQQIGTQSLKGRCMANECMRNMALYQNALGTQISPIERQVREIDAPILRFLLDMGLKAEAIHPTRFAREKALVICPVVFIGNPTVDGKKWRKES